MNNPIRYPVDMKLLPHWAYSLSELIDIRRRTIKIIDGTRYEYDNVRYQRDRSMTTMSRLNLL